ncbi:MAG: hypothetical protein V2B19_07270 [Pseudomonadota bacterium]
MMSLRNRSAGWRKGAHFALIWIVALFLMTGCGTLGKAKNATMNLFGGFGGKGDGVKQRVVLIPFENRTPWDENQSHTLFMAQLVEMLGKKCPQIILVGPGGADYPEGLSRLIPPAVRSPDNIGLAKTCREAGFNGVITGHLTHISAEEEKRGWYGFRKTSRVARIKLDAVLYHAGTAAKLMDESFSFDVEMVPVDSGASTRKWVINDSAVSDPLADCAKTAAKTVCEKISSTPWEGAILSMEGDKALIPFGESSGLAVGDKLEAYGEGRQVDSAGGYRYIIPGVKIGEMKISAVFPRKAEVAAVEGGGAIRVGSVVRLKK